jgi:acyl-[acyl carrier protein]--UDP-N-acetylglucosamine O-acyltransferase
MDIQVQMQLRRMFKILFLSGLNRSNAVKQVEEQFAQVPQVMQVLEFIKSSHRGLAN